MGPISSCAPSVSPPALISHFSSATHSFAELRFSGNRSCSSSFAIVRRPSYYGRARRISFRSKRMQDRYRPGSPTHAVRALRHEDNGILQAPITQVEKVVAGLMMGLLANTGGQSALVTIDAATTPDDGSNFKFVVICVAEAIALTGAAVGGILARQRKVELEKINAQLRQINVNLRRQSRVESYAPNLTYAPVGSGRLQDAQMRRDPVRDELIQTLKAGKRLLREKNPADAFVEFGQALGLAQQLKDTAEEKKAVRGLGASCQRQGRYKEAINYHMQVLKVSKLTRENSGDTEAYGAIADCYTELGDLETAGKYYDLYIDRLETDDTI